MRAQSCPSRDEPGGFHPASWPGEPQWSPCWHLQAEDASRSPDYLGHTSAPRGLPSILWTKSPSCSLRPLHSNTNPECQERYGGSASCANPPHQSLRKQVKSGSHTAHRVSLGDPPSPTTPIPASAQERPRQPHSGERGKKEAGHSKAW